MNELSELLVIIIFVFIRKEKKIRYPSLLRNIFWKRTRHI
jgi:hypothetical protein